MQNADNLKPNSERTPEERKSLAKKAGVASGAARRRKKSLKNTMKMLLDLPVSSYEDAQKLMDMQDGFDWLCFDLPLSDPAYAAIQEERLIQETTEGQTFRIKKINGGKHTAKIYCQLDLHEWQSTLLMSYSSGTRTTAQVLNAIKPAGWTVASEQSTKNG